MTNIGQSNHARLYSAACTRLGMKMVIVKPSPADVAAAQATLEQAREILRLKRLSQERGIRRQRHLATADVEDRLHLATDETRVAHLAQPLGLRSCVLLGSGQIVHAPLSAGEVLPIPQKGVLRPCCFQAARW